MSMQNYSANSNSGVDFIPAEEIGVLEGRFYTAKQNRFTRAWKRQFSVLAAAPLAAAGATFGSAASIAIILEAPLLIIPGIGMSLISTGVSFWSLSKKYARQHEAYNKAAAPAVKKWLQESYKLKVDDATLDRIVLIASTPVTEENVSFFATQPVYMDTEGTKFTVDIDEEGRKHVQIIEKSEQPDLKTSIASITRLNDKTSSYDSDDYWKDSYVEKTKNWLKNVYNVDVSIETAREIATQKISNDFNGYDKEDSNFAHHFLSTEWKEYVLTHRDGEWFVQENRLEGSALEDKYDDLIMQRLKRIRHFNDSHAQMSDKENSHTLNSIVDAFTRKIDTLKNQVLTQEDEYVIFRAESEAREVIQLAEQLHILGDEDYLIELESSLTLLEKEVDSVLRKQVENLKNKFAEQKQFIVSRSKKTPEGLKLRKNP